MCTSGWRGDRWQFLLGWHVADAGRRGQWRRLQLPGGQRQRQGHRDGDFGDEYALITCRRADDGALTDALFTLSNSWNTSVLGWNGIGEAEALVPTMAVNATATPIIQHSRIHGDTTGQITVTRTGPGHCQVNFGPLAERVAATGAVLVTASYATAECHETGQSLMQQ